MTYLEMVGHSGKRSKQRAGRLPPPTSILLALFVWTFLRPRNASLLRRNSTRFRIHGHLVQRDRSYPS
jgi:hypothetical protein